MKISAAEEYALRCLLQLARWPAATPVAGREIAQAEGMTVEYAEKVLNRLTKAGLVKSARGAKGGYSLTRTASQISVGDALRAADGRMVAGLCERFKGSDDRCTHMSDCGLRSVWVALDRQIFGFLNNLTLADLLRQEGEVRGQIKVTLAETAEVAERGQVHG